VIGRLFPDFAEAMEQRAAEAAESRLWSGIHYRSDIDVGLAMGRQIGEMVIERAAKDGSPSASRAGRSAAGVEAR
jgi:hypothetical protein